MHLRPFDTIDANCRYGAYYALATINGATHTLFVAPIDEENFSAGWEVQAHLGDAEDDVLDENESLIGSVSADSWSDARRIAEALVSSNLALLPFFDAIDACLDRLSFAYGEDRISALFAVEPALAIAI